MAYKNKEILTCVLYDIATDRRYMKPFRRRVKRLYDYLVNYTDTDNWMETVKYEVGSSRAVHTNYKQLIHSLNHFNKFKL